ncbi:MAG: DUF1178 family protein [Pseudomonadota bacterium]
MIRYALTCSEGHKFESWFSDAAGYDALKAAGHLTCAICGSSNVEKALMAPKIATSDAVAIPEKTNQAPNLSEPLSAEEKAISEMRRKIEETSDYVGKDFATQARDMHEGTIQERPIYGEANGAEAKSLIEDGVPILPLPFKPNRKAN